MPDPQTDTPRVRLMFCIDGLPLRDELVIKSLVRLLSHRTHHHWIYSPEKADLKVVGNVGDDVDDDGEPTATSSQVLRVGRIKRQNGPFLSLPVHSNELELMLNDLGKRINESRRAESQVTGQLESNIEFRLLKWPPAALLQGPGRMRVATLIMGRPMTAAMLAQRSGVAMDECARYVRELHEGGFLVMNVGVEGTTQATADGSVAPSVQVKEKVASGLLSRIRRRLGLAV